jgi:DNA-binding response OmpR family regulator
MLELKTLRSMNVLIAEDDAIAASFLGETLKGLFNTVFIVSDGQKALEVLHSNNKIDLLVTDLAMPYFSGTKLIEAIRKHEQGCLNKPLPIIVVSGRQETHELMEIIKHQLVDYILKPFSLSRMLETLERLCIQIHTQNNFAYAIDTAMIYNPLSKSLQEGDEVTHLTHLEALLLEILLENRGRLLSKPVLMEKIYNHEVEDVTFRNLLMRLRKKLGKERLSHLKELGIKLV